MYHIYQDHKYDGYHRQIGLEFTMVMDDGDHNKHEVWYDFLQVHFSYSYEVYPDQDRGVELGFYDCHDAYDMANDMADELCPGVEDTCFDMFISSGFMKCSSCCEHARARG